MQTLSKLSNRIVEWIKNIVSDSGADGIVLGLSGGVDSAVVGALCKRAVGEKLLALIMPCHSEQDDMVDSEKVPKLIKPTKLIIAFNSCSINGE